MNLRLKSWLLALALSTACAGIVAGLNLLLVNPVRPQLPWLTHLHVACAFIGALAFTRFIQGAPAALQGPTSRATVAQGVVAYNRTATVNFVVPGKNAFFSTARCLMIVCFVLCFMAQFVKAGEPADDMGGSHAGTAQQMRRLGT
ncbi:hypothetical protein NDK50_10135 [Paraburkholderia bryophila]|uniref:hypothetical protein n=1 Tax=Paraburkholderia bryophila TaxID=420952 RepID=UPI002349A1A0|nr:hypothetical protein [Paraburkholderia bryophila]WCM21777.1 hypothetical protein NDK50_10135 [Paraburkholderia bryophila]